MIFARKKKYTVSLLILFAIFFAFYLSTIFYSDANRTLITLTNEGFSPANLTIEPNTKVVFKSELNKPFWPASNYHPSHSIDSNFDPKLPIYPNDKWSYTFSEPGIFAFHDHLQPEVKGVIVVTDISDNLKNTNALQVEKCEKNTTSELQYCLEQRIPEVLKSEGLVAATDFYNMISELFPESCHGFGHTFGKSLYKLNGSTDVFLSDKNLSSSCGYGVWHGFITEYSMANGSNPESLGEFCNSTLSNTDKSLGWGCFHGLGIGFVDEASASLDPNDISSFSELKLEMCDLTTKVSDYRTSCYQGMFHGIYEQLNINSPESLTNILNPEFCKNQTAERVGPCFYELAARSESFVIDDIKSIVDQLEDLPMDIASRTLSHIVSGKFSQFYRDEDRLTTLLNQCRGTEEKFHLSCIDGMMRSLLKIEGQTNYYDISLEFCGSQFLNDAEKNRCYSQLVNKVFQDSNSLEPCSLIEERFKPKECL